MNFHLARLDEVDAAWPRLVGGFAKVCKRAGNITVSGLHERVRTGSGYLLIAFDENEIRGAAVCTAEQWSDGPRINVMAFWGEGFKAWRDEFMDAVRALGRLCGADTAVFSGPAAYERLFPTARVIRQTYEVK